MMPPQCSVVLRCYISEGTRLLSSVDPENVEDEISVFAAVRNRGFRASRNDYRVRNDEDWR